jgi:putative protease
MPEEKIGVVSHYFGHLEVAAIDLTDGPLAVGDTVHILGHTSDFTQPVNSIQIEHESVEKAKKGDAVGIKVIEHARVHDVVYKVIEEE